MNKLFKSATDDDGWLICWTGCATDLRHWNVVTNHVQGGQLSQVSRGPQGDAELIAQLLNWYYDDPEFAEEMIKECEG